MLLNSVGVRLVLVHGSRPQIEERLSRHGLASRYHNDLRITDSDTLGCVMDAVGSLRIGSLWESLAIPELRAQAAQAAIALLR